jgi:hypothetical protein
MDDFFADFLLAGTTLRKSLLLKYFFHIKKRITGGLQKSFVSLLPPEYADAKLQLRVG